MNKTSSAVKLMARIDASTMCECGHWKSEHLFRFDGSSDCIAERECPCRDFREES